MGTMFDFDISMVIVSDSGIGAAIADYGLSLVDLFYANDAGWNVCAVMGYAGGESSSLLALASLAPSEGMRGWSTTQTGGSRESSRT